MRRGTQLRFAAAALTLAWLPGAGAHDIPGDVTVQAFLKPSGDQLHLLVRVPLQAMRDVDFRENAKGYLDLDYLDLLLPDAATLWISDFVQIYEGSTLLPQPRVAAARVSFASDRSFTSYEEAWAHLAGPKLRDNTSIFRNQLMLDVALEYQIHSDQSRFSIHPALDGLAARVTTVLRFLPPGGGVRAFEFQGDPGLVRLDPRWHQAAWRFVLLGFQHILSGADHLLFLFCLVIPFRRFRSLIPVVSAFTVAHSLTLIASASNLAPGALWFPPLIETLIAASIVYMALENIIGSSSVQRRWIMAFGFGLVHGFGFSFVLRQTLQFAGSHLLTSLLSFNVGVELGQILVILLLIPAVEGLFRFAVAERMGTCILSALVAHTGWHWMMERSDRLRQFPFEWPALTSALLATALQWMMLVVALAGIAWLVFRVWRQRPPWGAVLRHAAGTLPAQKRRLDGTEYE